VEKLPLSQGCKEHRPYFGDNKEFRLEVEKSCMGRNAGDGVVNRGEKIHKGVLFGPYSGQFIPSVWCLVYDLYWTVFSKVLKDDIIYYR
jgi:hypothetical protein